MPFQERISARDEYGDSQETLRLGEDGEPPLQPVYGPLPPPDGISNKFMREDKRLDEIILSDSDAEASDDQKKKQAQNDNPEDQGQQVDATQEVLTMQDTKPVVDKTKAAPKRAAKAAAKPASKKKAAAVKSAPAKKGKNKEVPAKKDAKKTRHVFFGVCHSHFKLPINCL